MKKVIASLLAILALAAGCGGGGTASSTSAPAAGSFKPTAAATRRAEHAVEARSLVDATCTPAHAKNTWHCVAFDTPATNSAIASGRVECNNTVTVDAAGSFSAEREYVDGVLSPC
jgi:hypothetical protein